MLGPDTAVELVAVAVELVAVAVAMAVAETLGPVVEIVAVVSDIERAPLLVVVADKRKIVALDISPDTLFFFSESLRYLVPAGAGHSFSR